jgi:hypothetical protein
MFHRFFIIPSFFSRTLERCETQSVAAQMLHASGEREGRRLDRRRDRIPSPAATARLFRWVRAVCACVTLSAARAKINNLVRSQMAVVVVELHVCTT